MQTTRLALNEVARSGRSAPLAAARPRQDQDSFAQVLARRPDATARDRAAQPAERIAPQDDSRAEVTAGEARDRNGATARTPDEGADPRVDEPTSDVPTDAGRDAAASDGPRESSDVATATDDAIRHDAASASSNADGQPGAHGATPAGAVIAAPGAEAALEPVVEAGASAGIGTLPGTTPGATSGTTSETVSTAPVAAAGQRGTTPIGQGAAHQADRPSGPIAAIGAVASGAEAVASSDRINEANGQHAAPASTSHPNEVDGQDARHGGAGVPSALGAASTATDGSSAVPVLPITPVADAAQAATIAPSDAAAARNAQSAAQPGADTSAHAAASADPTLAVKLEAHAEANADGGGERHAAPAPARAMQVEASIRQEGPASFGPQLQVATESNERVATALRIGMPAAPTTGSAVADLVGARGADTAEPPAAQRVVRGLAAMVNQRGGAMTMRLSPPALGNLKIQMTMAQGTVSAQFTATTAEAQSMLNKSMPMLRAALESHGLQVERLGVQLSGGSEHAQQARADSNGQQPSAQDGGARHDAGEGESRGRREGGSSDAHRRERQGGFAERLDVEAFRATQPTPSDNAEPARSGPHEGRAA